MDSLLTIRTLGALRISRGEQPLDSLPLKARALLVYLAMNNRPHSRPALAALLWGGMPENRARANLRLALSAVRSEIGDALIATRQDVQLSPDAPVHCDAVELTRLAAALDDPDTLRRAVALFEGEFLADLALSDAPEFEEWALVERERLRQLALDAALRLADSLIADRQLGEARSVLETSLSIAPWSEEAHRKLIQVLAWSGERSLALAQYERCRRILEDEFGAEPSDETQAVYEAVLNGSLAPADVTGPANASSAATGPATQPPVPLTAFIGRDAEIAELGELLRPGGARLVTLFGPGGSGKTRLALAAAERFGERFRDGAVFVPLAGSTPVNATDAANFLATGIAQTFGYIFEAQAPPHHLLAGYLAQRQALIILDNFEWLVSGSPMLRWLLERAPGLTFLVTSRERLGVPGERVVTVGGLPYPQGRHDSHPMEYDAVRLFAERAREIRPDLVIEDDIETIGQICRQVDGHPLAIELATSWVRVLSIDEIAERVERDQDLLSTNAPGVLERHRSLRAVCEQTTALLPDDARRVLRRLSVFRGGWEQDAAEQVAGARLPALAGLADRMLIRRDSSGRFDLHEIIRQFAANNLADDPADEAATRSAHARYFTEYLRARLAAPGANSEPQTLVEIDREADNLRAAWEHLVSERRTTEAAAFLDAYWRYLDRRGRHQEIASVLQRALQLPAISRLQRARWLRWLGEAHYQMGSVEEAREHLIGAIQVVDQRSVPDTGRFQLGLARTIARQAALRLLPPLRRRAAPDEQALLIEAMRALYQIGQVTFMAGERGTAFASAMQSLNLAGRVDDPSETVRSYAIGAVTMSLTPAKRLSRVYYQLAQQSLDQVEDPLVSVVVHEVLGLYSLGQGDWSAAEAYINEQMELLQHMRHRRYLDEGYALRALIAYWTGDLKRCIDLWSATRDSGRKRGDPMAACWGYVGVAEAALRQGAPAASILLDELDQIDDYDRLAPADLARVHGTRSACLRLAGDVEAALAEIRAGIQAIRLVKAPISYALPGYDLLLDTLIEIDRSGTAGEVDHRDAEEIVRLLNAFARIHPIAEPAARRGRGYICWKKGRNRAARDEWQSALRAAGRLGMPFEQARAHLDLASIEGGEAQADHLRLAREGLKQMGIECAATHFNAAGTADAGNEPG